MKTPRRAQPTWRRCRADATGDDFAWIVFQEKLAMTTDRRGPGVHDFDLEVQRLAESLKSVLLMLYARPAVPAIVAQTGEPVVAAPSPDADRLAALEKAIGEVRQIVTGQHFEKAWYTTTELAEILGRSQFTVQERWCNDGRIECEKDPDSGKWRIPGHEVQRLRDGGLLRPKRNRDQR